MNVPRRRFLQALGVTAVGLAGCQGETDQPESGASPTEAAGSSTPPGSSPTEASTETPQPPAAPDGSAWHVDTGPVVDAPLVVDGTVYAGVDSQYAESGTSELVAVESDGAVRWRTTVESPATIPETVVDGVVYAISGATSDGWPSSYRLHAVDAADGSRLWRRGVTGYMTRGVFVGVGTEAVFVGTRDDSRGNGDETLYAIDRTDGNGLWSAECGDVMDASVVGDTVLVGAAREVQGFDANDGTRKWTFEHDGSGLNPAPLGENVVIGGDSLRAIDPATGAEQWRAAEDMDVASWGVYGESAVVGGSQMAAFDEAGARQWTYEKPANAFNVVANDDTLFATSEYDLLTIDRTDGSEVWRTDTGVRSPGLGGPSTSHVGVSHYEQGLLLFDAASGEQVWSWSPTPEVTPSVAVDGTLVVGTDGGGLFGIRP